MAPSPDTRTYTAFGEVYTYTYNYPTTDGYGGYDPFFNDSAYRAVTTGYFIAIGLIFGLQFIALIVVAIVYFKRQKRRKAWYGPMAAHYRNGGLPPWVVAAGGSVKAPIVQNNYSPYAGRPVATPPIKHDYSSYPPTPSQPQYVSPQRNSAYTPYEGPPQTYKGY